MAKRRATHPIKAVKISHILERSKGTRALSRMLRLAGNDVLVLKGSLNQFIGTIKTSPFEVDLGDGEVTRIRTSLIDDIIVKNPAQPSGDRFFLADGGDLTGTVLADPVVMHTLGQRKEFKTAKIAGIVFGG